MKIQIHSAGDRKAGNPFWNGTNAFSLLEVMIALAIFFMCVFAILSLVSRSVAQARNLRPIQIDATSALAQLSITNRLEASQCGALTSSFGLQAVRKTP